VGRDFGMYENGGSREVGQWPMRVSEGCLAMKWVGLNDPCSERVVGCEPWSLASLVLG
jgi:hypothetical protein